MRVSYIVYGVVAIVIVGLIVLFSFNPENTLWMPKCPMFVITGLKCPACGFQRALHSLLHLNFAQSVRYNFFLIISVPYAISLVIVTWLDPYNKLKRLKKVCYSRITIYFYLVCFVAWGVVRNIMNI